MIEGFSLGNYVLLVEYTGRLFRERKAVISGELAGIFERLGSNAENWQARLQKLAAGRLLGRGTERVSGTRPERVSGTHLGFQDGRSGQEWQLGVHSVFRSFLDFIDSRKR